MRESEQLRKRLREAEDTEAEHKEVIAQMEREFRKSREEVRDTEHVLTACHSLLHDR